LVIAPFFISFLLRTFAWKQLFSNESWVVTTLQQLHILGPDQYLVGTDFMVIFGLTYNFIPFMTLPLYTALERLDLRLLEAGSDLYATPAKVFRKVTLPITMPGIISGFLLAFIISLDDFIITNFVKGAGMETLPTAIFGSVKQGIKPNILALSTLMLTVSILFVTLSYFVNRLGQRSRA
jgi:spermidine/putrescine transport system permease protein